MAKESEIKSAARLGLIFPQKTNVPVSINVDENVNRYLESLRIPSKLDVISSSLQDYLGYEEKKYGYDEYEDTLLDEDGKIRTYKIRKDLTTGQIIDKILLNDIEGVNLEDVVSGKVENPYKAHIYKQNLLKKIASNIEPDTDEFRNDIGKSIFEFAWDNTAWSQIEQIAERIAGKPIKKFGAWADDINQLQFKPDGIYYAGTKLNLGANESAILSEWLDEKTKLKSDGFIDTFAGIGLSLILDYPIFAGAGKIGAKFLNAAIPGLLEGTSLPGKFVSHVSNNAAMLFLHSTPRLINYSIDEGTEYLADDIFNTAKFALLAGAFGSIGDEIGIGVSKLLQRNKPLQLNEIANFLRKHPRVTKTLVGGLSSGALGYITGGETDEEKIATALLFASMHFATPSAWKNYLKGRNKDVMVEKDDFDRVIATMRANGLSFAEAIDVTKSSLPQYYIRDGDVIRRINRDKFITEGSIEQDADSAPIKLTEENARDFRYITDIIPYERKALSKALKDGSIREVAKGILEQFPENPYNPDTQADLYKEYEFRKMALSNSVATLIVGSKLNKLLRRYQLPRDAELDKLMVDFANKIKLSYPELKKYVIDNFDRYIQDPERFLKAPFFSEEGYDIGLPFPDEFKRIMQKAGESFVNEVQTELYRAGWERLKADELNLRNIKRFTLIEPEQLEEPKKPPIQFKKVSGGVKVKLPKEVTHWYVGLGIDNAIPAERDGNQYIIGGRLVTPIIPYVDKATGEVKTKPEVITTDELKTRKSLYKGLRKGKIIAFEQQGKVVNGKILSVNKKEGTIDVQVIGEKSVTKLKIDNIKFSSEIKPKIGGEYEQEQMGIAQNQEVNTRGVSTEASSSYSTEHVERKNQPSKKDVEEAQEIISGKIPTVEVIKRAKEILGGAFETKFNVFKALPTNKARLEAAKDKTFEEGVLLEDFARRIVAGRLINESDYSADIYGLVNQKLREFEKLPPTLAEYVERGLAEYAKEKTKRKEKITDKEIEQETKRLKEEYKGKFPKTFEIEPGKEKKVEPISNIGEEKIEAINVSNKAVQENKPVITKEIREKLNIGAITDAADELRRELQTTYRRQASMTDFINDMKMSKNSNLIDKLFTEAERVSNDLKNYNIDKPVDVLITSALDPYYTAKEIATILAYKGYGGGNNGNEVNVDRVNYIRKSLGLQSERQSTTKSDISAEVEKEEFGVIGMRQKTKTELESLEETETKTPEAEIPKSKKAQIAYKILELPDIKPNETYGEKVERALKEGLITKEDYDLIKKDLYETEVNGIPKLDDTPETRRRIENEFRNIFGDKVIIEWDIDLPEGKTAVTYVDKDGKIHVGFTKLASVNAPLEERIHAQALLASDQVTVDRVLKELVSDYDGIPGSDTWRLAHEELVKAAMRNIKDKYGLVDRIREIWQKLYNFFRGKGWYSSAEFYRKLLNNELDLSYYAKLNNNTELYESVDEYQTRREKELEELAKKINYMDYPDELSAYTRWEMARSAWKPGINKADKIFKLNKIAKKIRGATDIAIKSMIQANNYAYQTDSHGNLKHPIFNAVYELAQKYLVNGIAYDFNLLYKDKIGWNDAKNFRDLGADGRERYMAKLKAYDEKIALGEAEPLEQKEGETFEAFANRVKEVRGFTDAELEVWKRYQITAKETLKKARDGYIEEIMSWKDNEGRYRALDGLNKTEFKKIFGKMTYEEAKDAIQDDENLRRRVAETIAYKIFPEYKSDYYNTSRPIRKGYYIIRGFKPLDPEGKEVIRFYAYGRNEKDAKRKADEWHAKGFAIEEFLPVDTILESKRYDKLSANQLLNLADAGHIPYNNEVIRALLDAVKSGRYEQHTIKKEYILGMEYSPMEYEESMLRLVNEAVSRSTRRLGVIKIRDFLDRARQSYDVRLKSPLVPDNIKEELRNEYDYTVQYYNQVIHSDQSFIDGMRQLITTYYIGFKPSFWFQQMFQPLQNTLPEAISELGKEGAKIWSDAFSKAMKLAYIIRAEKNNEKVTSPDIPDELIDLYHKLDNMRKLGAIGIEELTGGGDPHYHYANDIYKGWRAFSKLVNMTGSAVEKFTRIHALATVYEIGKRKGLSGNKLEDYIVRKIDEIMSLWGAAGRPAITQPKILGEREQKVLKAISKSFYTLRTFSLSNLGQYDRLMRNRKWGALGAKMLIGTGLHGVVNFPFIATAFALVNLFTDNDSEYETLKALDELDFAGVKLGKFIGRGFGPAVSLNLAPLFDERSVFASDIIAETRSYSAEGKLLESMLGAPYGLSKDFLNAAKSTYQFLSDKISTDYSLTESERKRIKQNMIKLTPVFVRNILNAMSYSTDGVEVKGDIILKSDDLTWGDVFYKILGFSPYKVAEAYEDRFYGPAEKLSRVNGRIIELKKIRKEIQTSKEYDYNVRKQELQWIAKRLIELQRQKAILQKQVNESTKQ